MFACPNCGGNLKFDIPSQQLSCEYCHTQADPYSFDDKDQTLFENKEYEATVFTCPQCGGEILSADTSAAEFCTFCGASTILHSRLVKEKRPDYIIPFKQTKEDCKNAYTKMMKKAIFAPDELKNPKYIDSFRGIYMPYWAFYMTQQDSFCLHGTKSHRRGDYVYTDHYDLKGDIDAYYKGLSYDASSSFDDSISEKIAPYDVKGMKTFTPAYLSGFYADTADVSPDVYEDEANQTAYNNSIEKICGIRDFSGYSIEDEVNNNDLLYTATEQVDSAMFPVWFMAYRNGDRVAYATVNGQTGKVVTDLPVDPRKYLMGSLLLAVPIFILLNLFFTVIPSVLLTITAFLAIITNIVYSCEITQIVKKEKGEEDKGRIAKEMPEMLRFIKNHKTVKPKKKNIVAVLIWIYVILMFAVVGFPLLAFIDFNILWIAILIIGIISAIVGIRKKSDLTENKKSLGFVSSILAVVAGAVIPLLHPVNDLFFYGGAIFSLLAVFFTIKDIIFYYNILSTRRLPQFDRTGGDDRA